MYMKKRGKKKLSAQSDAADPSSPPPPHHKASILDLADDFDHRLGDYQLMEGIGKGGYGTVYRGLHISTGQTVAVKRIALAGIPQSELEGIRLEMKLLEALEHPNIVKYLDSIQTEAHLFIILEFVENGALSSLLSKFGGAFPESLVCHYIGQVLMGLQYLHQQGVIHRDIKGANILSTKDGGIKLADFGVATKLNESRKSDSVVGTPYWMAPEIIEMTGQQSSACDIWSVGCTVLELLTGKPPYFDLQQMPALFRIVQDEHPPLPDGISPALKDFLLMCFAKDPNRRIDAAGLLKHPWLKKTVEKDKLKNERERAPSAPQDRIQPPAKQRSTDPTEEEKTHPPVPAPPPAVGEEEEEDWDAEDEGSQAEIQYSRNPLAGQPLPKDLEDFFAEFSDDESHPLPLPKSSPKPGPTVSAPVQALPDNNPKRWEKFVETDEADAEFDDFDEHFDASIPHLPHPHPHPTQPPSTSHLPADDESDLDPFDDIEFTDVAAVNEEEVALKKKFHSLLALLIPDAPDDAVMDACEQLMALYKGHPGKILQWMSAHAVIPIMEMLTVQSVNVVYGLLKLINLIIVSNQNFLQSLCLVGLIPAIIRFASAINPSTGEKNTPLLRLEAANFIRQFCYTSDYTRKMFLACDGLQILITFLYEDFSDHLGKNLIFNAIDCIRHVFDSTFVPKNDFCRLFCKFEILPALTRVILEIVKGSPSGAKDHHEYLLKICQVLYWFAQGDSTVKQQLAQPHVFAPILDLLPILPPDCLLLTLKSICALSMDSSTLDDLEHSGVIPAILPHLSPSAPAEHQHQVLLAMYYLCQLKGSRQEAAAVGGIIPQLKRFIEMDHPLKQFAYPIMFQMCKCSKRTRAELKKFNGVLFYLNALKDPYWRSHALEVISIWLMEEPHRVGFLLTVPSAVNLLLYCLTHTTNSTQFEKMLGSVRKLLLANVRVNQTLGRSFAFVHVIRERLATDSNNAIRVHLLNILSLLLVAHEDALQLASDHDLLDVLERLATDKDGVLVASLAQKMQDRLTAEAEREEELAHAQQKTAKRR